MNDLREHISAPPGAQRIMALIIEADRKWAQSIVSDPRTPEYERRLYAWFYLGEENETLSTEQTTTGSQGALSA